MKLILIPSLLVALAIPAAAQQAPLKAEAALMTVQENGDTLTTKIWITNATRGAIRYLETITSTETKDLALNEKAAVYLIEPREYSQALDLYQARKYKEAQEKFAAIKTTYKPVELLAGNHGALAGFYEMECLRKLGDLEGLSTALGAFKKDGLTREHHLRQLELNVIWDTVRIENWERAQVLADERSKERMPDYQRAQVAYFQALTHEKAGKLDEALTYFQMAMVADAGASEDIARLSALKIMKIIKANPEVQTAIDLWGGPKEKKTGIGYNRLLEAGAVARLYELSLGGGKSLPAEFTALVKYKGSDLPVAKEADKPKGEKKKEGS